MLRVLGRTSAEMDACHWQAQPHSSVIHPRRTAILLEHTPPGLAYSSHCWVGLPSHSKLAQL